MWEVEFYETENGKIPVEIFLKALIKIWNQKLLMK